MDRVDHTEAKAERRRGDGTMKHRIASAGCLLLACVAVAASTYAIGLDGEADLDAARAEGTGVGQERNRQAADRRGYAQGRRQGERAGYRATYRKSYKTAYRKRQQALRASASAPTSQSTAPAPAAGSDSLPPGVPPGSEYTDQLPHGEPGYVLPEDQRTLACVGVDAVTGECIGD
jgi:hypothetical protein